MAWKLAEMTWPAVESKLAETGLVVVPTASLEQHGPHLPLSVDTIRADVLGAGIASELDCFLAPTIRPGLSAHHMAFPGTITLDETTFKHVVAGYCESLDEHGFTDVALLTTHGGNTDALEAVATTLDDRLDAHVFVAGTRAGLMAVRETTMEGFGVTAEEAGAHAGAAETAFVLQTNPELVEPTDGATGYLGAFTKEDVATGVETLSENGVLGDPERATIEQGRELIDASVAYFADEIRAAVSQPQEVS